MADHGSSDARGSDSGGEPPPPVVDLRRVVFRFERPLLAYARRLVRGDDGLAREVVQETFLCLCRDGPAAAADRNGHLAQWLYTVCRSRAIDALRKEQRMAAVTDLDLNTDAVQGPAADPSTAAERHDTVARLLDRLAVLPAAQQEAIRLKFQHGLSYREIAAVIGTSESNVGVLIHVGLKALRAAVPSYPW